MDTDAHIAEIARGQHSLVTLRQLRSAGMTPAGLRYRQQNGRLERLEPRLYRIGGALETWHQRVLGACMSVGEQAVACRRTAAILWEILPPFLDAPVEIAVARPRSPKWVSARVFRSTDIIAAHRAVVADIPVTTVARTLVDLGAVVPARLVEDAVDVAMVKHLVTPKELEDMLDNVARQGRRGVGALRSALDGLAEGPESVLEMKLLRLILRSTLPRPEIQHWVEVDGVPRFRVDAAYPRVRLAIEADGRAAHSERDTFSHDRERQGVLEDLGWRVLRFTWMHVTQRPNWVISRIRNVYNTRMLRVS